MAWVLMFTAFGVLMLISSDILEALKNKKLANRHAIVAMVWFVLAFIIVIIERTTD